MVEKDTSQEIEALSLDELFDTYPEARSFLDEKVKKARQEEKDKLYARMEDLRKEVAKKDEALVAKDKEIAGSVEPKVEPVVEDELGKQALEEVRELRLKLLQRDLVISAQNAGRHFIPELVVGKDEEEILASIDKAESIYQREVDAFLERAGLGKEPEKEEEKEEEEEESEAVAGGVGASEVAMPVGTEVTEPDKLSKMLTLEKVYALSPEEFKKVREEFEKQGGIPVK